MTVWPKAIRSPYTVRSAPLPAAAVGPDGKLKNASEIEWYHDPDGNIYSTSDGVNAFLVLLSKGAEPATDGDNAVSDVNSMAV